MLGFQLPFLNDLCLHPVLLGPVGWVPPNGVCTWVTHYNAVTSTQQVPEGSFTGDSGTSRQHFARTPSARLTLVTKLGLQSLLPGVGVLKLLQSPSILNTAQGPSTKSIRSSGYRVLAVTLISSCS